MATQEFELVSAEVGTVETEFRRICTAVPTPESVEILTALRALEPRAMGGQPPIVWDHGRGVTVSDPYGNRWLDFSSGVLVTSVGHGHPAIIEAIERMAAHGLYHAYCFPTAIRLDIVREIMSWLTKPLARVLLLTTGAEAVECCIKLARTQGLRAGGRKKNVLVTFDNAFHGRTMGAQLAGGIESLKTWMGDSDARFVQVPFPDGFRQTDTSFDVFERALQDQGIAPDHVCGVMSETYQGCNATILPTAYAQALRAWCDEHQAVMVLDEVQAGFGRTGKAFGFSHLGVVPDLVACGKGMSGGMPMSAVLGTDALMNLYGPGEMTSTHSANPICCAAALANLRTIREEHLVENAAKLAPVLREGLEQIRLVARNKIGRVDSIGLVGALQFTEPGTTEPAPTVAREMVKRAVQQGVMLFAPVGVGGCAVKINPPLLICEEALREGLGVLEAIAESL